MYVTFLKDKYILANFPYTGMLFPDANKVKKALVSLALEESLLEIGGSKLLHEVFRILYEKFQSYLPDCYDHPEYLRGIFAEIDSGTADVFLESINEKLAEYAYQRPIGEFLVKISKIKCSVG